ncbi:MAG: gliding motility-associated protein GldE [Flavobacteriaceae bacterium]|nr:gliding motility-associated protein GldE [Flavobacteriaceae bacterium]
MDPEPILSASFFSDLNSWTLVNCIILFSLLICSALVSGAEVAFFSLTRIQIEEASENSSRKQNLVAVLLGTPKKLLATILIANNFINILVVLIFAYLGEIFLASLDSETLKFVIEVVLVTFLIVLFGEVLPKVYATRNAMKFASFMAFPIKILRSLLSFFSIPMIGLTSLVENRLSKKQTNISVESLSQALELTATDATSEGEKKILEGIVSFGGTETNQIMTPRIDIFALSIDEPYEKVLTKIIKKGFSRNPVYKESVDEIIGVLYTKDLLPHMDKKDFNWKELIRTPYFVPENKKLDDLLSEFQEIKSHLAIVVDEYGGTSGIVTLEDVIEEIVGDISDEFDDDGLFYSKIDINNYVFEGKTALKDFYKIVSLENLEDFEEEKGESETIAGFILEISGRFPKENDQLFFKNCTFVIEAMDKRRIKQVKITISR